MMVDIYGEFVIYLGDIICGCDTPSLDNYAVVNGAYLDKRFGQIEKCLYAEKVSIEDIVRD